MDDMLEQLLKGAAEAVEREEREKQSQVAATVSKADLAELLAGLKADVLAEVQKATVVREEGAGRKGVVEPAGDPRDADPATYVIQKAQEVFAKDDGELSQADKELAWGISHYGLTQGMSEL